MKLSRGRISSLLALFMVLAATLSYCQPAGADPHWLTGSSGGAPVSGRGILTEAGPRDFDLTISIYNDRAGDNDGNTQGADPGSAEQDKIERIIQHFADMVFSSSEGQHRIRNVRIFREGKNSSTADCIWEQQGHPHATLNGIADAGLHFYMYDIFTNGAGAGNNYDMLADEQGCGYTFAHEWYHYALGLKDEYQKNNTQVSVQPSVMTSQWNAKNDNKWFEFSIKKQTDPPGEFQDTEKTDHHAFYGESCWETLARSNGLFERLQAFLQGRPLRPFYAELAMVAPTGNSSANVGPVNSAAARAVLDIIWIEDTAYEIVIDKSGSMSGTPLANAQTAANLLIDLAEEGKTKIGIVAFDSSATVRSPIIEINSQADKDGLKAVVNSLTAGGGTAIGAGAQLALDQLNALATDDNRVTFLLSDGVSGDNALAPIPGYQAAQIPIFAFSYGDGADTVTLGQMASETGGRLFISPTTLAEVTAAFQEANAIASGNPSIAAGEGSAPVGSTSSFPFDVDSSLSRLDVVVTTDGTQADATIQLVDPQGNRLDAQSVTQSGGDTLWFFSIDNPADGEWEVEAQGTAAEIPLSFQVSGIADGPTYTVDINTSEGEVVEYPNPVVLMVFLGKELPVTGAQVRATITLPDASQIEVELLDDGNSPDAVAGDGTYSVLIPSGQDGTYQVEVTADNGGGTAALTNTGLSDNNSPNINGGFADSAPDAPVNEDFERAQNFSFQVQGVQADDHGNVVGTATALTADNSGVTPGRIDSAGDVDMFAITVPAALGQVAIRLGALGGGLNPVFRVLGPDGVTELARGTAADIPTAIGYLVLTVNVPGDLSAPVILFVWRSPTPMETPGGPITSAPVRWSVPTSLGRPAEAGAEAEAEAEAEATRSFPAPAAASASSQRQPMAPTSTRTWWCCGSSAIAGC
ncbi:MAG: VWA domain-containing protein [Armatimonadetes bacterium]|nr:VWA domain-containing protein [Armatimonadota bacterium]